MGTGEVVLIVLIGLVGAAAMIWQGKDFYKDGKK